MSWDLNDEQCFCSKRSMGKASREKRIPLNTGQIPVNVRSLLGVGSCVRRFMCVVYWWHGGGWGQMAGAPWWKAPCCWLTMQTLSLRQWKSTETWNVFLAAEYEMHWEKRSRRAPYEAAEMEWVAMGTEGKERGRQDRHGKMGTFAQRWGVDADAINRAAATPQGVRPSWGLDPRQ